MDWICFGDILTKMSPAKSGKGFEQAGTAFQRFLGHLKEENVVDLQSTLTCKVPRPVKWLDM